jgi:hypothetical protein
VATYTTAARVLHIRVASATPGPDWGDRCVALDLELIANLKGSGPERPGEHIKLIIRQSTVTAYDSRPAGAWWIVEQSLAPGSEYVAYCPSQATESLRSSCNVVTATPELLSDLRLVKVAETDRLSLAQLAARVRASCATSTSAIVQYMWERHGAAAARDPAALETFASLLELPGCSRDVRGTLLGDVYSLQIAESPPVVRRIVRVLFVMLGQREAQDFHDNLVGTYLPNALGLTSSVRKTTATEVFGRDHAARERAASALRAYNGSSDASALRAWIK